MQFEVHVCNQNKNETLKLNTFPEKNKNKARTKHKNKQIFLDQATGHVTFAFENDRSELCKNIDLIRSGSNHSSLGRSQSSHSRMD